MKKAAIAAAVFVLAAAVSAQERPALEFLAVPLGATEAEFAKQSGSFTCKDVPRTERATGDRICTFDKSAEVLCAGSGKTQKGAPREKCRETITTDVEYGGARITWGAAAFYGDKLARVTVEIKPDDFDRVISALQAQFGKPTSTSHPPFVTQKAARDENTILKWVVPPGSIEASKYGRNIGISAVTLSLDSWDEEFARRKAQQKQEAKKR